MDNFYKPGDYIDYVNAGSAITAGDIVQAGDIIGVAVKDIAASTGVGPLLIKGIIKVTKTGSQAWTLGQTVYYAGSNVFTTVASGNARAGVAAAAVGSGSGETTGYVLINTTPGLDIGEIQSHIADPASAAAITAANPAAATSHTITDGSTGTASTSAIPEITAVANAGSADLAPVENAVATLAAELVLVKADLAAVRAEVVKLVTDVTAVRTGSEANNTAIDSINAALAAFKVTAAS